jgi:hypothetical protein
MYQVRRVRGHVYVCKGGTILPLSMFLIYDFGIILTVWYFGIILTVWYFGIILTVWYFGIILTVWYFSLFHLYNYTGSLHAKYFSKIK